jgi:hypothetical protein
MAVPFALPGRIALDGANVLPNDFGRIQGALVALNLDDGSNIFNLSALMVMVRC